MSIFTYGPEHVDFFPTRDALHWEDDPAPRSGLSMRLTRESLGLSAAILAAWMDVSLRTAQYWEASTQIPPHAEAALKVLEEETRAWGKKIAGAKNIIVHRDGYRKVANSWIDESWWRALVGKAVSETGATASQSIDGYAVTSIWKDDEYYRFEVAGPQGEEEFRTGKYGEALYALRDSGTISLPDRTPIMEWKQILGSSQFGINEDPRKDKAMVMKLLTDLEIRDHARNLGMNPGVASGQIGGRYIGQ